MSPEEYVILVCTAVCLADGEAFESGQKQDSGVVLRIVIGPAGAAGASASVKWSNEGLHLSSKVIAYAMEYTVGDAPVAGGGGGAGSA